MTNPVVPRTVPAMPAAPDPNSPPAVFDAACIALANRYSDLVPGMNNCAADTNTNAVSAKESADAAALKWDLVSQGVSDIQEILPFIQSGPVLSVNGRAGVVTGLVETSPGAVRDKYNMMADAPIGYADFSDAFGGGQDWPLTNEAGAVLYWNVHTYGTAGRKTQEATQILNYGGKQGWRFVRYLHDTTWSAWERVLGDRTMFESWKLAKDVSGTYTADPAASVNHWIEPNGNLTVSIPTPLSAGAQLTLRLVQRGSHSFAFSGNVVMPDGVTLPSVATNKMQTVILTPLYEGLNAWIASIGDVYSV